MAVMEGIQFANDSCSLHNDISIPRFV
jgi:hypothetical protein